MSTATQQDQSKSPARRVLDHIAEERFTGLLRVRSREASGDFWFLAGILESAQFGVSKGEEAIERLLRATEVVFEAELRLPHLSGGFKKRMPSLGNFAEAKPVVLMRYCETYALTCSLVLKGKDRTVRLAYRVGDLLSADAAADGNEALPALLESEEGTYEFVLPTFELPAGVNTVTVSAAKPSLAERIDRSLAEQGAAEAKGGAVQDPTRRHADEAAEAKRKAEAAAADAKRQAEEAAAEAKRKADQAAAADAKRRAEEAAAEAKRKADQAAAAEARRKADQAAVAEARRKADQAAVAEAKRKTEEAAAAEAKRKADQAAAAEAKRKTEEAAAAEAKRKADQVAAAEAKRKTEEAAVEAKRKAEAGAAAEAKRQAEEVAVAEQAKRKVDEVAAEGAKGKVDEAAAAAKRGTKTEAREQRASSSEGELPARAPMTAGKRKKAPIEAATDSSEDAPIAARKRGFPWMLVFFLVLCAGGVIYLALQRSGLR